MQTLSLIGAVNSETVPSQLPMFDYTFLRDALVYAAGHDNEFGVRQLEGTLKLLNYLGYGNYYGLLHQITDPQSVENACNDAMQGILPMNFMRLLAYQKIYYSYYRNSKYESNAVNAYNIDWIPSNKLNLTSADYNVQNFQDIFRLHHRWLKKDYFMSSQPSVLPTTTDIGFNGLSAGIEAGMNSSNTSSNSIWQVFGIPGFGDRNIVQSSVVAGASNNAGEFIKQNYGATQGSTQVNVSALRFAFAFDKLLRRMRTAGATFDDQMLAQFGIKPVDYRHGDAFTLVVLLTVLMFLKSLKLL